MEKATTVIPSHAYVTAGNQRRGFVLSAQGRGNTGSNTVMAIISGPQCVWRSPLNIGVSAQ
jgi:hypothetical protein